MALALVGLLMGTYGCLAAVAINVIAFGVEGTPPRLARTVSGFAALVLVFAVAGWSSETLGLGDLPVLVIFIVALGIALRRRGRPRTPDEEAIRLALQSTKGRMVARVVAAGVVPLILLVFVAAVSRT